MKEQQRHMRKFRLNSRNYYLKCGQYCSRGETVLNLSEGRGWVGDSAVQPGPLTLEQEEW